MLETIRSLELELLTSACRRDGRRLEALLHPEFFEIGMSGRHYTRADALASLLGSSTGVEIQADAFNLQVLGEDTVLLIYHSALRANGGGFCTHALRTSLWQRGVHGWQIRFHQGTPMAQPSP